MAGSGATSTMRMAGGNDPTKGWKRRGSVELITPMAAEDGQSFYAQLCNSKRQVRPDPTLMRNLLSNVVGTVIDNYSRIELGNLGVLVERASGITGVNLRYSHCDSRGEDDGGRAERPFTSNNPRDVTPASHIRTSREHEVADPKVNHFVYRSLRRALAMPGSTLAVLELPGMPIYGAGVRELAKGIAAAVCLKSLNLRAVSLGDEVRRWVV